MAWPMSASVGIDGSGDGIGGRSDVGAVDAGAMSGSVPGSAASGADADEDMPATGLTVWAWDTAGGVEYVGDGGGEA
jgi:hypothetical protein